MTPCFSKAATPLADSTNTRPTTAMTTAVLARPPPPLLRALRHQDEARPDDGEDGESGGGVGHRREHGIEGFEHFPLLHRGRAGGRQRDHEEEDCRQRPPHHGHSHPNLRNQSLRSPPGVCSADGSSGSG